MLCCSMKTYARPPPSLRDAGGCQFDTQQRPAHVFSVMGRSNLKYRSRRYLRGGLRRGGASRPGTRPAGLESGPGPASDAGDAHIPAVPAPYRPKWAARGENWFDTSEAEGPLTLEGAAPTRSRVGVELQADVHGIEELAPLCVALVCAQAHAPVPMVHFCCGGIVAGVVVAGLFDTCRMLRQLLSSCRMCP